MASRVSSAGAPVSVTRPSIMPIDAVGHLQRLANVLLDDDDGCAGLAEAAEKIA